MKNKITILVCFQMISFTVLEAQNLVLNPSFEDQHDYRCTVFLGGFNKGVTNWTTPNFGSTDFFDTCSKDMGSNNYNGYQEPKSGQTFAGIYVYTDKNYREYIQGELFEVLTKGETYKMTFYVSLADKASYALKDIEVLFTEEKLKPCYHSNNCEKNIKPASVTKKKFKIHSDTSEVFFKEKRAWQAYNFEFVAEGYERFFSIGNFYRNNKTKKQKVLSSSPYLFSYYYIDDVSLIDVNAVKIEIPTKDEADDTISIETNKTYTFKNVLFDFNKAELLEVSKIELDTLFKHIVKNKDLKVNIFGHTDNIGLEKRNRELSQQRAKAVADYLISLGLDASKIKSFGFGSSKPISDNKKENGRQQNRRVEFQLINK